MEQLHTPEEMQFLSNLGHWIEGGILGSVALIALLQAVGFLRSERAAYLWPSLIFAAGLFLPPYMLLHHGLDKLGLVWNITMEDPQQRQHFVMAVLLLIAGLSEVLVTRGIFQFKGWKLIWPSVLITIGILFLIHTQHGTEQAVTWAVTVHQYLGVLLIASGAFRAAEVLWAEKLRWLRFPWGILLLICAILLLSYHEPEGVFETMPPQHHQHDVH